MRFSLPYGAYSGYYGQAAPKDKDRGYHYERENVQRAYSDKMVHGADIRWAVLFRRQFLPCCCIIADTRGHKHEHLRQRIYDDTCADGQLFQAQAVLHCLSARVSNGIAP